MQYDTYSWVQSHNSLNSYMPIYEFKDVELKVPKTIDTKKYYSVYYNNRMQKSNKVFLAKLNNAKISCSSNGIGGACVRAEDDTILDDIIHYWGDSSHDNDSYIKLSGTYILASEKWGGHNYCHWLLTTLPKLGLAINNGFIPNKIITNSIQPKFIRESLNLLDINLDNVVQLSNTPKIQANELITSSPIGYGVNADRNTCDILRNLFKNQLQTGKRKIYVSRSSKRKILNESEVLDVLLPYGFEVIKSENLSLEQQISTFSQAEIVIGPHGAGLTNIVFCEPGTKVLEISPPTYIGHCYWILGDSSNLDLYYLVGEGPELYENQYYWSNGCADITVNIKELKEILNIMEL